MDTVRWTAYDALPGTSPAQVDASAAEFLDVLKRVEVKGVGYVEVCRAENDYPLLALSLAEGRGVVHQFASATTLLLLAGDGSVDRSNQFELPVMDGSGLFTGAFVLTVDAACEIVRAFTLGAAVSDLGEWTPL